MWRPCRPKKPSVDADLADIAEVGRQHRVRVAADRILGDTERGAEHARFGRHVRGGISIHRENEKAFRAELGAELEQGVDIRGEGIQLAGIGDRYQQAGAALAGDARRHDLIERRRGKAQGFGDPQGGLERQRRVELGQRLTKFEARAGRGCSVTAVTSMMPVPECLPARAGAAPSQREQYRMGGHGRVPDEGRFFAGVEKAQANIMVGRVRGEHEGHLGVGELAREASQGGVGLPVGVEDDRGWIAVKRVDVKASTWKIRKGTCLRSALRLWRSFARIRPAGYTSIKPWGGLS